MGELGEQASNGNQKPPELTPPTNLKTELVEIYDQKFSTLGHGTRPDTAKKILMQGLRTNAPNLLSTCIPLLDNSRSWEEQADGVVNQIQNWPHLKAKAVVIIMIPNPDEGTIGGNTYFNSVFQGLPEADQSLYARYYIPASYIKGYVDVKRGVFIRNPNFNPEKPHVKTRNSIQRDNKLIPISNTPVPKPPENGTEDVW